MPDLAGPLQTGGLILAPRDSARQMLSSVLTDLEVSAGRGAAFFLPADGRLPESLMADAEDVEHLADPNRRKDLRNPDLVRITLPGLERTQVMVSLQDQAEAIKTAVHRGAGAILLDGLQPDDQRLGPMIIHAAETGHLMIVVGPDGEDLARFPEQWGVTGRDDAVVLQRFLVAQAVRFEAEP